MSYNVFDRTDSAMPKPAKGIEIVKLLLSQASEIVENNCSETGPEGMQGRPH